MNITTIELPIYDLDIVIVINDWQEANKKFNLQLTEEDYEAVAWTIYEVNDHEIYMLLKDNQFKYITHELFHVISAICKMRGIIMEPENDEPLAYLQGYIAEKIFLFRDKYLSKQASNLNQKIV